MHLRYLCEKKTNVCYISKGDLELLTGPYTENMTTENDYNFVISRSRAGLYIL